MAEIIIAPNKKYNIQQHKWASVFLAGGITNCPDWQKTVCDYLKPFNGIVVYNPRRENWTPDISSEEQVAWEYEQLEQCNILSFWFASGSLNPIALYELGRWANHTTNRPLIIGCDRDYERTHDVKMQTMLSRSDVIWVDNLNDYAHQIILEADKINRSNNIKQQVQHG